MTPSPPLPLPTVFVLLLLLLPPPFLAHFCYSCSGICHTGAPCNCQMGSCEADFCFADKRPSDSSGVFRLTKGCVKRPQRTRAGCDFAHHADHVHCICSGDFCNDSVLMRVHTSRRNVTCRKCPDSRPNCGQTCQGQWCHVHVSTSATGCGFGPPSLPYVYQSYELFRQRSRVCVSLSRSNASPHEICVCNANFCNDPEAIALATNSPTLRSNPFVAFLRSLSDGGEITSSQKHWAKSPAGSASKNGGGAWALSECVNCDMSSGDAAMTSNCRQNRCWGHFCVYATQRVFVGGSFQSLGWSGASAAPPGNGAMGTKQAMMHERQGCMNASERTFVQLGCSHKWVANEQEEIFCACKGNLCNSDLSTASASSVPSPNSTAFPPFLYPQLLLAFFFFFHLKCKSLTLNQILCLNSVLIFYIINFSVCFI